MRNIKKRIEQLEKMQKGEHGVLLFTPLPNGQVEAIDGLINSPIRYILNSMGEIDELIKSEFSKKYKHTIKMLDIDRVTELDLWDKNIIRA